LSKDPSDLLEELAVIKHVFAQTKAKDTKINLIGDLYTAAHKEYIEIITMEELIPGDGLELEHQEEVMGKMWRHSGGKPGNEPMKNMNAFAGCCYECKEKGHRATHCPNKKVKKSDTGGTGRNFNGNCNQCGHQVHKKSECWDFPENEEKRHVRYKMKM